LQLLAIRRAIRFSNRPFYPAFTPPSANPELWFTGGMKGLLWARLGAGAVMAGVSFYWAVGVRPKRIVE
jgi:hypothetical protein